MLAVETLLAANPRRRLILELLALLVHAQLFVPLLAHIERAAGAIAVIVKKTRLGRTPLADKTTKTCGFSKLAHVEHHARKIVKGHVATRDPRPHDFQLQPDVCP